MSKKRKALLVFFVLVVGSVPAYFWLFTESTVPSNGQFEIDIGQLRLLADSVPGEKPTEVRFEELASLTVPLTGIIAGSGWNDGLLTIYAFQLVYPDHATVLIDTGLDKETADDTSAKNFDDQAFARVGKALGLADSVVFTHEHYDHIGGAATHPNLAGLMPRLKLTKEQLSVPAKMEPLVFPVEALREFAPLVYEKATAIAAGVVLLKAAGHTPGSQMVFVKRADGVEYLFLGDIAWHWRNVQEVRTRARIAAMAMGEDRDGVLLQLKELNRLAAAEPKLQMVPGHDKSRIEQQVAGGFLTSGFAVEPKN